MAKLTIPEVKHIAKLANLVLSDEELEKFSLQLSDTLNYVEKLNRVDTVKIVPTSQTTGLRNVFREDKIKPSLSQEEATKNGRRRHNGYFVVKSLFE